jgi:hypothetical protein
MPRLVFAQIVSVERISSQIRASLMAQPSHSLPKVDQLSPYRHPERSEGPAKSIPPSMAKEKIRLFRGRKNINPASAAPGYVEQRCPS